MARGNPGRIFKVTAGSRVGQVAVAYHKEQDAKFAQIKKLYAHFYIADPVKMIGETKENGLIDAANLSLFGMVD